jgi:endo-1,4-beta-xylanase
MKNIFLSLIAILVFSPAALHAQTTLKEAYKKHFLIGVAVNRDQFTGVDTRGAGIVKAQFNSISPENILKWESVHPEPNRYAWDGPDAYVAFGEKNKMFIIGHTLVWHNQAPKWIFEDAEGKPASRELLISRLKDHIYTVVGRYKGRIKGWDVVNEALNEDGTLRQTQWMKIIGEDYLALAFQFAHEADPKAQLYYNDYSLENEAKRNGAVELIKKLLAKKIPVKAVGLQGHNKLRDFPTLEQQDATIEAFADLGIKVSITELDIDVLPRATRENGAEITTNVALQEKLNPYKHGLPEAVEQELAKRYADLFGVYLKHRKSIERVTFWCVTDGDSWLNDWPVRGRSSYPLLFDRQGKPKPAFDAVIKAARMK